MKTKMLLSFSMAVIILLSWGFIIREKEENLNSEFTFFQNQECFNRFLSNLKRMEALVYIPEGKIIQARGYQLLPLERQLAEKLNVRLLDAIKEYNLVIPVKNAEDECSQTIAMTFNNLGMKVFVRKSQNIIPGDNLAVTPVPLPMPEPLKELNATEFTWKFRLPDTDFNAKTNETQEVNWYIPVKLP